MSDFTEAAASEGAEAELEIEQSDDSATQTTESTEVPLHTVKVRGQELQVTLDELINGYQRQSDYTKSTQDLAAKRQELEAAEALWNLVHESPQVALEAIEEHFAEQLGADPPDPRDKRLNELESWREEQQQSAIEQQVAAEIAQLQSAYEDNFDPDELLEYAIDNKIGNLEAAYVHRAAKEAQAAKGRERQDAKRNAPPVAAGQARAAGSQGEPEPKIESVRDAVAAALKQHGASSLI